METCKVTFYPEGKTIFAKSGTTILQAAEKANIYLNSLCGGAGTCGKCKVIVSSGEVTAPESYLLSAEEKQLKYALACATKIKTDLEVEIPQVCNLGSVQVIDQSGDLENLYPSDPLTVKIFLTLPEPTLTDNTSDLQRLCREIRRKTDASIIQTDLAGLKNLPELLRKSKWQITVTLGKRNNSTELLQIEQGNTADKNYGIAVDVGTTTIVAHLVDLNLNKTLGKKAIYNQQVCYGEDVISRIIYAEEKEGLAELTQAVVSNINSLIQDLSQDCGINLSDITCVFCAGNTTMIHLLLGVNPAYIRREPYIPAVNSPPVSKASEIGIQINPHGLLACVSGISSYIGGDIVAGTLASNLASQDKISMLIDIGTNGEIVLGNNEWLVCCSCSAGPAFEGSGVTCGMRAVEGAIERLEINKGKISYSTIGKIKPLGICGSGLVDCLAEMLKEKIINRAGKFNDNFGDIRQRQTPDGIEYVLVGKEESGTNQDITLKETDIENLVRSKAAVYAGASVLLEGMGLSYEEVDRIFIAGGFGNYLNIAKAVTIGLLPDLPLEKFAFIGNSSLMGAKLCLLSAQAMKKAEELASKMTYFELSTNSHFMEEYVAALFLPHTHQRR